MPTISTIRSAAGNNYALSKQFQRIECQSNASFLRFIRADKTCRTTRTSIISHYFRLLSKKRHRKRKTPTSISLITIIIKATFHGLKDEWSNGSVHVLPVTFTRIMKFTRPHSAGQQNHAFSSFRSNLNSTVSKSSKSRATHELLYLEF